jgi:hypothetical protein
MLDKEDCVAYTRDTDEEEERREPTAFPCLGAYR